MLKKCSCKKSNCESNQCSCHRREMFCSQLCLCVDCENHEMVTETDEDDDEPEPLLDTIDNDTDMNVFDRFFDST